MVFPGFSNILATVFDNLLGSLASQMTMCVSSKYLISQISHQNFLQTLPSLHHRPNECHQGLPLRQA